MTNPTQQAARLLVKCGYALYVNGNDGRITKPYNDWIDVEWEDDTLEGRRQLDALEDYLIRKEDELWICSFPPTNPPSPPKRSYHQWRQDRVRWCLEQLGERDE